MRKEIIICDMCKKEVEGKDVTRRSFDTRFYEVCTECGGKFEKANEEYHELLAMFFTDLDEVKRKYGLEG